MIKFAPVLRMTSVKNSFVLPKIYGRTSRFGQFPTQRQTRNSRTHSRMPGVTDPRLPSESKQFLHYREAQPRTSQSNRPTKKRRRWMKKYALRQLPAKQTEKSDRIRPNSWAHCNVPLDSVSHAMERQRRRISLI